MPGPNATDSNFERTFASLAYARLRDKAPTLLDYIVGFQLIDKNEDETHAIGVFGFKVGSEWVYAPTFFINGELKGHELMYLKSQDAFVPLVEEWVNYILNRRPQVMGKLEQTNRSQLGMRQPDFDLFSRAPYTGSKMAGVKHPSWGQIKRAFAAQADAAFSFEPFMDVFTVSPKATKFASVAHRFDLRHVVRSSKRAAYTLVNTMRNDHKFAEAVMRFYDLKDLLSKEAASKVTQEAAGYAHNAAFSHCKDCNNFHAPQGCEVVEGEISPNGTCKYYKAAGVRNEINPIETVKPIKSAAEKAKEVPVVVITRQDDLTSLAKDMTDADKAKLLTDNYVVKDERTSDQRTRLYKTQVATQLQNPDSDGYYEVATAKGGRKKMIILTAPQNVGYAGAWTQNKCVVIDPEAKKFGLFFNNDVLVHRKMENKDWAEAFDKLSSPKSLSVDDVAVILTPKGNGTVSFRVDKKWTNPEGQTEFDVHSYYMTTRESSMQRHRGYSSCSSIDSCCSETAKQIVLTGKDGNNITQIGSTLFIPDGCKAVKLPKEFRYSMGGTVDIGTLPEIILGVYKTASAENGVHRFQLRTDGIRFHTVVDDRQGQYLSKLAMVKHLIMDHGMGVEDAEFLLKTAQPRKAATYYVKYAAHFDYNSAPNPASFPEPNYGDSIGLRGKTQYSQEEVQNLGADMRGNKENYINDIYIDDAAKTYAQQASQQGQKEILDTAVISGLVKTMDTDSAVDSYISDMLLGLDRVGRVLFMYYWHNEKFKDRYGQQDMVELEDNLRNVFKNMGELALFLKMKTIEPDQGDNSEVELDSVLT